METSMQPGSSASSSTSAIFYYSRGGRRVGLRPLRVADQPAHGRLGRTLAVEGREDASRLSTLVTSAARGAFEMDTLGLQQLFGVRATPQRAAVLPTAFEDEADRRIRVVYKELVLRFKPGTHPDTRRKLLEKFGLAERRRNPFVPEQVIVTQPTVRFAGTELVDAANRIAELDELLFAVPNFVSEFQRQRFSTPRPDQWHLRNTGAQGAKAGEDARALGAWVITRGSPSVAVAILDDGVDILHPCLRGRLVRNPDARNPKDRLGRDFFVPADQPDHYDPSPKRFRYPYDRMDGNDIHGTPCAGVVASDGADGHRAYGIAPRCRILPVKIFHGDELATDAHVADAIRYAARFADVLSCSWSGPQSPDIEFALDDAKAGRGGRGAVICAASGNEHRQTVGYPAADHNCIAVGASTDQGLRAEYSNFGPELSLVAPSSGGARGIYTTDVSVPHRGFNVGTPAAGDAAGLYTKDFGGTSSATPLVAGVAALLLSRNPNLTRAEVKRVLESTARKIGSQPYGADGKHLEYGHGCVDAEAALEHELVAGKARDGVRPRTAAPRARQARPRRGKGR